MNVIIVSISIDLMIMSNSRIVQKFRIGTGDLV